ncbi:hypothetical protein TELCIR_07381 [Teladorsagia circumcincta]|uniref:Major facilitator superfamily (MFS) profile domain-containing protein n=1 Tax=Teladorsagia circumcincta TaxID=45464 RepID=A0A2G9UMP7_TELCI|nr:hypothetical protein TELCIR_07381 [Teladorsagia circumcincta]
MGTTAQGVFLAEISPVAYRGVIGSFGGFSTNIGFIFASALGLPDVFGSKTSWPYAFYLEALPCMILIIVNVSWFCDSPVFLLRSGDESRTYQALSAYCGRAAAPYEMDRVISEVKAYSTKSDIVWNRGARRALLLSLTLNIVVSFSGILAVSFFGTFLLQSIGFSEHAASLANCISGLSGTNLLFTETELFGQCEYLFSAGIGPTAWFLGAELAPAGSRARMQSMSVAAQSVTL